MKIGVALGGGGARGLAHIGVLKVFEKNKIPISQISGTSIGAVVGGLYAVFRDAGRVEAFMYKLVSSTAFQDLNLDAFDPDPSKNAGYWKQILNNAQRKMSIYRTWRYKSMLNKSQVDEIFIDYPDSNIETLPISFAAVATDLVSGRETVLVEGRLKQAVVASSSIPGVFPPVEMLNTKMCDGGVSDLVPVYVSRGQGAQYVIAVDVTKSLNEREALTNGLSVIDRAQTILAFQLSRERLAGADFVIRPSSARFSWASVRYMPEIIQSGEDAAEKAIPAIREALHLK
ncbi:MAG: patatin-like phospholipase family protein [Bacteroidales bacterium]|nr:patatin-like phospholipase family protein [Bacteroidales bacterium]MCF6341731.1 patatin-like phospholipase family protein [Bacteroidales bacterium]